MTFLKQFNRWSNLRVTQFLIAGFCACLILAALYFEHYENMIPCPLCMFQRVFVVAFGVVFLLKGIFHPTERSVSVWFFDGLGVIFAALGAFIAGRHVWLTTLPPDQVPACGPDLNYLMDALPFLEVIETVLHGSGECAKVDWWFLGLSMPGWMLVIFCGGILYSLLSVVARLVSRKR